MSIFTAWRIIGIAIMQHKDARKWNLDLAWIEKIMAV